MNSAEVLKYGHLWVHQHVDDLDPTDWEVPNVCGVWSTRQIIAHLASFEVMLCELLGNLLDGNPSPTLDEFRAVDGDEFNARQVGRRAGLTAQETLAEYDQAYAQVSQLIQWVPAELLTRAGALPWYGAEYDLEDFLVYTFYGHKREHCAQIAVFRDNRNG